MPTNRYLLALVALCFAAQAHAGFGGFDSLGMPASGFASDPANCPIHQSANGVDALGAGQSCFPPVEKAVSVGSISGTASGPTILIGTPNDGTRFYPLSVIIAATAATAVTVAPSATVGQNSPSYNDIIGTTVLTGLTATNAIMVIPVTTGVSVAPATNIQIKITAGTATTLTLKVILVGVYE